MRILIVTETPYIPQHTGGVESSTHDLALELKQRGHSVAVLCQLATDRSLRTMTIRVLRKLSGRAFPSDRWLGYPVYRQWDVPSSIAAAAKEFRPDVAIVQISFGKPVPLAQAILSCGVPLLFYLRNVQVDELGGDLRSLVGVQFIANSRFTAGRYKELFGIESIVIPPLVRPENYVSSRRRPSNVTFVNPHVLKGLEIALKVAENCADIPFTFVESWTLDPKDVADYTARIAKLPNVTLLPRTDDMKSVYRKSKILLAPSIWDEAWGRVATEAQFSGIPVVASNRGGLPEAVGPGGVLLDPGGPIEPWVETVRRLWHDREFYDRLSAAALAYSRRPEIDPKVQVDAILAEAETLIGECRSQSRGARHA